MSPEYAMDGAFSIKSDVYSFGVLVIEIVSGKKNRFFSHPDHNLNLMGHVSKNLATPFVPFSTILPSKAYYKTAISTCPGMEEL